MPHESHQQWLLRLTLPSVALTAFVFLWSGTLGIVIYRILGVSIGLVNGRPATFIDEVLIRGLGGALAATFLNCVLLLILLIGRIHFRWWILIILLQSLGTPIALVSAWKIADYLWTLNQGGVPWEGFAPQVLGVTISWIVYIPIAIWLSRYRFVIVRRSDQRNSPCPRCGYDLYGSSGSCPECGWQIPIGATANRPPSPHHP